MSESYIIKVKCEDPKYLPVKSTEGASCFDVFCKLEAPISVAPGIPTKIPLGFSLEMESHWECQIRPRSGCTLRGLVAQLGTIDSDYRGPVSVTVINMTSNPIEIKPEERVAQIKFQEASTVVLKIVDSLSETARGSGGFGSTGR